LEELQSLRNHVDNIDCQILKALSERVTICQKIGEYKKQHNLPVEDHVREKEVFSKIREAAVKFQLEPTQIEKLYREIVNMCIDIQK